jgi:homotetrameric cytidine deaminase
VLEQRDTYFAARRGRLKLRQDGAGGAELIGYRRADDAEPSESRFVIVPITAVSELIEALDATLGTVLVVAKRRRLFLWEGVRIHLDDVEGLGSFIEFEAVLPDAGDLATAHAKVARLRSELGIADDDLVGVGYADLLMDAPSVLLRAADAAMRNAHAPYSHFKVGAAVRATSGAIYAGANVENVAYPQGQCAEASAIGALVSAGETAITAVAVVAERVEACPPCGGCRQRLSEFGGPEVPVYLGRPGAWIQTVTLGELLPLTFDRGALSA